MQKKNKETHDHNYNTKMFHMKGGEGEYSYSKNSKFQKLVILKGKEIIEESVAELCKNKSFECLRMVDMGCSSGPTTMIPLREIIETIDSTCTKLNKKPPELQYFLNDLPGNDYNTIFRSFVSDFRSKLEKEKARMSEHHFFIAAMPGNFYERLFPTNFLHFVYSSNSLHWASQVPRIAFQLDKGNICLAESSPESVRKMYKDRFEKDFSKLLRSRSVEVVSGGHMVFTFTLQTRENPNCKILHLLGDSLKEMVNQGILEEAKVECFKVPYNAPKIEDVTSVIEKESSFKIKKMEKFEVRWDANIEENNSNDDKVFDKWERGKFVGNCMRAVTEPMVSAHFGDAIDLHHLYHLYSSKLAHSLDNGTGLFNFLIISITRI